MVSNLDCETPAPMALEPLLNSIYGGWDGDDITGAGA
jgi:hypothetical protein